MKKILKLANVSLVLGGCCLLSSSAFAAAFQSFEQSAATLGTANAGTAVTDNPSIQYYNPAGMSQFKHTAIAISGEVVAAHIDFHPTLATNYVGEPIKGNHDGPGRTNVVPAFYFIQPIDDRFTFGFGTEVPFGLATRYNDQSLARYFATESKIETVNLNPSLAYKISKVLSVGVGFDAEYIKAKLGQVFDAGSFSPIGPLGDVGITNKANDWGFGWNAGIFYQPTDATKFGLGYHSQVHHELTGHSSITGVPNNVMAQGFASYLGLVPSAIDTNVTLPGYATFSVEHNMNTWWHVMFDAEYINWHTVQSITINFKPQPGLTPPASQTLPPETIMFGYHDTWRFALGSSFQITPKLKLRTGIAYDQTPVRQKFKDARLPDGNRTWVAVGAHYQATKCFSFDLGYAHVFIANSHINQTLITPIGTARLDADYEGSANLFGAQLNYKFA